ncbi:hypothetical protein NDN08_001829 [Rhodosorus marinus]|uniref:Endoplasmic reticulum transmembrane protein n=1 Tax=Rhodosorus marinus TaxID=101924 RepID=A0AAV8UW83_9RHOD|nr:hypothetical protein NDN08_001829 [Rhodosorus marinus]
MASPLWLGVYGVLCLELILTLILLVPLPERVEKGMVKILQLPNFISGWTFFVRFLAIALVLAVYDSIRTIKYMESKILDDPETLTGVMANSLDRERRFRAQRNLYLAGFALTLLFVIIRLVQMIRSNINLREELKAISSQQSSTAPSAANQTTAGTARRRN